MGFEFAVPAPPPPLPLPENASTKLVNRRLLTRLGLNDYLERSVPNLPKTAAKFSSETQVNSRLQALRSILAVVTGTESALFPLEDGRFDVASASSALKSSLKHYAEVGTQFRALLDFTDPEADEQYASRGRTFGAFRVALRATLHQLLGQTVDFLERRYAFRQRLTASEARAIESKISFLEVEFLFEEDEEEEENSFSNLLLTIRHLHAIFLRVTVQQSFEWPRLYAHQTLQAIAERLTSVPQRRLRSVLFTLLEHCLGPLFTSLEYLLTEWTSMEELTTASAASECLLASRFETDEELFSEQEQFSYGPTELTTFWADFLHLDEKTFFVETSGGKGGGGRLFGDGFQALIEAIKASFVFRLNGLQQAIPTIAPGALAAAFRRHLEDCCRRYALAEDLHQQPQQLNLETPYQVTEVPLDCPDVPLLSKPLFKRLQLERFTGYQLPLITELGLDSMLEEALTATYQQIARPINSLFLGEVRRRYLRLLRYYTDFFLLQKVEHLLQYVYRLFPLIRETSVEGEEGSSSLDAFASQLEEIHRRAGSVDSSLPADFAPVMAFFRPSFTAAIAERAMEEACAAEGGSPHTAHLQLFASLFFVPSFGRPTAVSSRKDPEEEDSEENFYDFWPLQRLFNADVSLLFNRLLQFLLKLRYSQYQLGVEFFHSMRAAGRLQSSSSLNVINSSSSSSSLMNLTAEVIDQTSHHHLQLTRAHYLGRHRLVTAVANIGLSLECRLKEVVGRVEAAIEGAASFDALLTAHQAFLRQVTQLAEVGEREEGFFASTIAATAKFCYRGAGGRRGAGGGGQKGHRFNRHRLSFYQNLNGNNSGRAMNQDEYFDSVQL